MNKKPESDNQMAQNTNSTDMSASEASFDLLFSQVRGNIHENTNIAVVLRDSLEILIEKLKSEESSHLDQIENSLSLANHIAKSLSSLLMNLTPPRLENQTLHQGLSDFVNLYKSAFPRFRNLEAVIDIDSSINDFPIIAGALFIIIKESITNALLHGKASKIEVSLVCSGETTNLLVSDNGCGFDVDERLTGSGINVMKSIAKSLNGNFLVESQKNDATIIRVSIPLPAN